MAGSGRPWRETVVEWRSRERKGFMGRQRARKIGRVARNLRQLTKQCQRPHAAMPLGMTFGSKGEVLGNAVRSDVTEERSYER